MNITEDRPTHVLDRLREPGATAAPSGEQTPPVALGWGSDAERRLMRQVLVVFALLGLYAVGFVLVGTVLWT